MTLPNSLAALDPDALAAVLDALDEAVIAVDAHLTVAAVNIARSIMRAPAMAKLQLTEVGPGPERNSHDEIIDWVKRTAETTYHPVGTCKMGQDAMAVVDHRLKVHGIEGLRVADASASSFSPGMTRAGSALRSMRSQAPGRSRVKAIRPASMATAST